MIEDTKLRAPFKTGHEEHLQHLDDALLRSKVRVSGTENTVARLTPRGAMSLGR